MLIFFATHYLSKTALQVKINYQTFRMSSFRYSPPKELIAFVHDFNDKLHLLDLPLLFYCSLCQFTAYPLHIPSIVPEQLLRSCSTTQWLTNSGLKLVLPSTNTSTSFSPITPPPMSPVLERSTALQKGIQLSQS